MGEKFPVITGKDLLDSLLKQGCELKRVKGSHHVRKSVYNAKMFVIPVHSNENLDRGTLRSILGQAGINAESFIELWEERK